MTWAAPALPAFPAIQRALKDLENALSQRDKTRAVMAKVVTTNATVTTLQAVVVPVNTTVVVSGVVAARRTGGGSGAANDGAGYTVSFVAKNTAGTAALIGSATVTTVGESQAGWDVTVSASGGTILVRVTGAADNTVSWVWSSQTLSVTE